MTLIKRYKKVLILRRVKFLEEILSRLKNISRILKFYNLIDGFRFLVASRRRRSRNVILTRVLKFILKRPQKGEGGAEHSWNLYFQALKYHDELSKECLDGPPQVDNSNQGRFIFLLTSFTRS